MFSPGPVRLKQKWGDCSGHSFWCHMPPPPRVNVTWRAQVGELLRWVLVRWAAGAVSRAVLAHRLCCWVFTRGVPAVRSLGDTFSPILLPASRAVVEARSGRGLPVRCSVIPLPSVCLCRCG